MKHKRYRTGKTKRRHPPALTATLDRSDQRKSGLGASFLLGTFCCSPMAYRVSRGKGR